MSRYLKSYRVFRSLTRPHDLRSHSLTDQGTRLMRYARRYPGEESPLEQHLAFHPTRAFSIKSVPNDWPKAINSTNSKTFRSRSRMLGRVPTAWALQVRASVSVGRPELKCIPTSLIGLDQKFVGALYSSCLDANVWDCWACIAKARQTS